MNGLRVVGFVLQIMIEAARSLALAGLRERYPCESPERLRRCLAEHLADLWLGPELAAKAYGPLPDG